MRRLLPGLALLLLASCAQSVSGDETTRNYVVFFTLGNANLGPAGAQTTANIAEIARRHPDRGIIVSGFAAAHGNLDVDAALSERRAQAVAAALESHGVAATQITEHARPPSNEDPGVAARRVEISFAPVQ